MRVRVFVVWERVLITDRIRPKARALSRLSDRRAAQFWDRERLVSQEIREAAQADPSHPFAVCCAAQRVIWDVVAVFPKGVRWEGNFPAPAFADGAVIEVKDDFRRALQAAANQSRAGLPAAQDQSLAMPPAARWLAPL